MNATLMEFQQAIKQQTDDLRDELKELAKWEEDIQQKEAALKKKTVIDTPTLPPIRGTAPTLKVASQTKVKEDPIQVAKDQGNEYFKAGKMDDAIRLYTKGIDMDPDTASTHVLYANRAQCYIKTGEFEKAERDATKCVQMNRSYTKAFFRRAVARKGLKKYKDARSDLETVLALQPGDNDAETELRAVTLLIREENKKSEDASGATKRKKIVICEVDDDEEEEPKQEAEEEEHPAETAARNQRIERDMEHLNEKRRVDEENRRKEIAREEAELRSKRKTHDRVEEIEDDEVPPARAPPPPVQATKRTESAPREASQPKAAPVPRNLKVEWTKETIKAPKNFTEFERVHKEVRGNAELLDTLISVVPPNAYKTVLGVSLTPELLNDILLSASRGNGARAKEIVGALSGLSRVGELAMFFDDKERAVLESALHLVQASGATEQEMKKYRKAFEI